MVAAWVYGNEGRVLNARLHVNAFDGAGRNVQATGVDALGAQIGIGAHEQETLVVHAHGLISRAVAGAIGGP